MKTLTFNIKIFEFCLIKYSKVDVLNVHKQTIRLQYVGIYKKNMIAVRGEYSVPLLLDWMKDEYLLEQPI